MSDPIAFPREHRRWCECETPSEYLVAGTFGWLCENCNGVVWDTSRADEGTISFAGANIVARALLDTFDVRRKP